MTRQYQVPAGSFTVDFTPAAAVDSCTVLVGFLGSAITVSLYWRACSTGDQPNAISVVWTCSPSAGCSFDGAASSDSFLGFWPLRTCTAWPARRWVSSPPEVTRR